MVAVCWLGFCLKLSMNANDLDYEDNLVLAELRRIREILLFFKTVVLFCLVGFGLYVVGLVIFWAVVIGSISEILRM